MRNERPIRRSQLISPWGIGGIINFRNDESLMVAGIDAWNETYYTHDSYKEFLIKEPRLINRLGIKELRLPPDFRDSNAPSNANLKIPFVLFPRWHMCPKCGAMELLPLYAQNIRPCPGRKFSRGKNFCHEISNELRRPRMIPSRFIAICEEGHIEDFPFVEWVHAKRNIIPTEKCRNSMRKMPGATASISGVKFCCTECDITVSMAGSFNGGSLEKIDYHCNGNRPWLGESGSDSPFCGKKLHVVQRGASNVFFPKVMSSIYIPNHSKEVSRDVIRVLDENWEKITSTLNEGQLDKYRVEIFAEANDVSPEELFREAQKRFESITPIDGNEISEEEFRLDEYKVLVSNSGGDNQDFYSKSLNADKFEDPVSNLFSRVTQVHKLRETRAFYGFTRINPENLKTRDELKGELSKAGFSKWLPGITVKGEGIFFEFDNEMLNPWSNQKEVINRVKIITDNYNFVRSEMSLENRIITAKFILMHTFSHILINQLAITCGYGSSSLRERIYCDTGTDYNQNTMNGVLIYTASGDAEGSLGGLVDMGKPGNLEDIIIKTIESGAWCSSDPICSDSVGQGPNSTNLAACHNCALVSETSCEEGNKLLDRGLMVGTLDHPDIGYCTSFLVDQES